MLVINVGKFRKKARFSRQSCRKVLTERAWRGHYPLLLPLSQTLLLGPIRKLLQHEIYGKLLMTGGNRSVYAWIIYITHNSLYFICILTGFYQRYLKKPQAEGTRMVPEVGIEPTCPCERRILSPLRLPVSPLRRVRVYRQYRI